MILYYEAQCGILETLYMGFAIDNSAQSNILHIPSPKAPLPSTLISPVSKPIDPFQASEKGRYKAHAADLHSFKTIQTLKKTFPGQARQWQTPRLHVPIRKRSTENCMYDKPELSIAPPKKKRTWIQAGRKCTRSNFFLDSAAPIEEPLPQGKHSTRPDPGLQTKNPKREPRKPQSSSPTALQTRSIPKGKGDEHNIPLWPGDKT